MLWNDPVPDTDDEVSCSSDIDLDFQDMDVNSSDDFCESDEADEGDESDIDSTDSEEEVQVGRERHIEAYAKQLSELVTFNQIGATHTHTHTHTHTPDVGGCML